MLKANTQQMRIELRSFYKLLNEMYTADDTTCLIFSQIAFK